MFRATNTCTADEMDLCDTTTTTTGAEPLSLSRLRKQ